MNDTGATARSQYIAGLRALADLLETHPALCLPATGSGVSDMSVMPKSREQMQTWVDALESPVEKIGQRFVSVRGNVAALKVSAFGPARTFGSEITRERVTTEFVVQSFLSAEATA
jgi:hypothetical protein